MTWKPSQRTSIHTHFSEENPSGYALEGRRHVYKASSGYPALAPCLLGLGDLYCNCIYGRPLSSASVLPRAESAPGLAVGADQHGGYLFHHLAQAV